MSAESVAVVTLGCGRNEADSDQVGGSLHAAGFRLVDDPADADCVLINTCTFIAPAREESIEVILDACDLPARRGPDGDAPPHVLVIGCMAERYGAELADSLPEAAGVLGFADYPRLPAIVRSVLDGHGVGGASAATTSRGAVAAGQTSTRLPLLLAPPSAASSVVSPPVASQPAVARREAPQAPPTAASPVRTAPRGPWAYLKIAGGCDRVCTFCTIPSYRGRFASRPLEELAAEAAWLVSTGARELVCVSENTTSWGKDLPGGRRSQADLIAAFDAIEGLETVRLMYLQPAEIVPELLDAMASSRVVAPYYDLSLQHASGPVLSRMARSGDAERFLSLINGIRRRNPSAVFRSSFIVGFPGETEEDVDVLAHFLAEARLDWAGFFTFSLEDGTPSATMPEQVDPDEARRRRDALLDVQEAVAEQQAEGFIGRELEVLVEAIGAEVVGRSYREAPETDGEVRIPADETLRAVEIGDILSCRVTGIDGVDLLAAPLVGGR